MKRGIKKSKKSEKKQDKILEDLKVGRDAIKEIKKEEKKKEKKEEIIRPNWYGRIANKFFLKLSSSLMRKGYFKKLKLDLRKANINFITQTYISIIFFTTVISAIFAVMMFIIFLLLGISIKLSVLILILPLMVFLFVYFNPTMERRTIERKINEELPFVAIHMSAIAGSGISPVEIFKVIVASTEYKYTKTEIKKLLSQINVYGYDIVTALKNTAKETSSTDLAELFNGLANSISSGGSLSAFINKRADTLLFEYKLEREKYNRTVETFMDIYISVIIAAPMIFMLLFMLMSITGMSIGISISGLTTIMLSAISLINILFLVFVHLRQPSY